MSAVQRAGVAVLVGVVAVVGAGWWWSQHQAPILPFAQRCVATTGDFSADLDPEQAGNAALITSIAVRRRLPARAASIAIATAIQESKLRNIEYGDRDSLGLFQQRPSQGWGTRDQVLDPVHATNQFYDHLERIDGFEDLPITQVAQRIQRSAYPQAYADHEPEARAIASALSGYSAAGFSCRLPALDSIDRTDQDPGTVRALLAAAAEETGRRGRATEAGQATFTLSGGERGRLAWSLAHWAVARSAQLRVAAVRTDGQIWTRGEDGWRPDPAAVGSGTVVVTVSPP